MRVLLFLLCLLPLHVCPTYAQEKAVVLFDPNMYGSYSYGPFTYGMPRSEVEALPGAEKGEDSLAQDIFLPEQTFAGLPWTVRLHMYNDKLVRVSLMEAYTRERMDSVTQELMAQKLVVLAIRSDSREFDIYGASRSGDTETVRQRMQEVMRQTKQSASYAWFDMSVMPEGMVQNARGLRELLMGSPETLRQVEVVVLADEKTHTPRILSVDFILPLLIDEK